MTSTNKLDQLIQSFKLLPLTSIKPITSITRLPKLPPRPITSSNQSPFEDLVGQNLNQWSLSNHIFPAAYPRTINGSSLSNKPNQPSISLNRFEDRNEMANLIYEANKTSKRLDHTTMKLDQVDEKQLFISVNRYFRNTSTSFNSSKGFTLILSHANGLHKETWEPMLSYLLQSTESNLIYEIWSLDCVNQGDSAILNQDSLGERFYWADTSRDLLQFIISYLPEVQLTKESKPLPMMLSEQILTDKSILNLSSNLSNQSKPINWRGRKICLIGHSLGGNSSALTVSSKPELINSTILIDPVINPPLQTDQEIETMLKYRTSLSTHRRSNWKTRIEAKTSFLKNQTFFGVWDSNVLKRYIQFGLYSKHPDDLIELKTKPIQESLVFADPFNHSIQVYKKLNTLLNHHESIHEFIKPKINFIFADQNQSVIKETVLKDYINELKSYDLNVIRIKGTGHLIVQEVPKKLANLIGFFLKEINQDSINYKL